MKVVGFVGPKGSGKDESFTILKRNNKVLRKLSFAGPLKDICKQVFGLNDYQCNDPDGKEALFKEGPVTLTAVHVRAILKLLPDWVDVTDPDTGKIRYNINKVSASGLIGTTFKNPRELMQFVGTEIIRNSVWEDWHVNAALSDKAIQSLPSPDATYAVTDVRFENELEALQRKFGSAFKCFYVERPEAEERLAEATHTSETVVKVIREKIGEEFVIKNDGTLKEFEKKLLDIKMPTESYKARKKSRFVYGTNS